MIKICPNCNSTLIKRDNENNRSFNERKFCNQSCSATFSNKNRKHSQKTKNKISNSLKSKYPKKINKKKRITPITLQEVIKFIKLNKSENKNQVSKIKRSFHNYIYRLDKDSYEYKEIQRLFKINKENSLKNYDKNRIDLIRSTAKKYETKRGFYENHPGLYESAKKYDKINKGFLKDITSHMKNNSSKKKRAIYAIKFPKINSIYIGLSYNIEVRYHRHKTGKKGKKDNIVTQLLKKGEKHKFIKLSEYVDEESAQRYESAFILKYKNQGYQILNSAKAGSLGASFKYTNKDIIEIAQKYNSYDEFKNNKKIYSRAQNRRLLKKIKEEIFNKKYVYRPNKIYPNNPEELKIFILNESKKHSSYKDLRLNNQGLYEKILELDLADYIKDKLFPNSIKEIRWSEELIIKKSSTKKSWSDIRKDQRLHSAIRRYKMESFIKQKFNL